MFLGGDSLVLYLNCIDTLVLFFYIFKENFFILNTKQPVIIEGQEDKKIMKAYQLTIPVENKPGVLAQITSILARKDINIRSATISSFGKSGFINLIVNNPQKGQKALAKEDIPVELKEIIAVLIEDRPGGLDKLLQTLSAENINIENGYGFVIESRKNAVFVIDVNDIERAKDLIEASGFKTLTPQQLSEIEPFHYVGY